MHSKPPVEWSINAPCGEAEADGRRGFGNGYAKPVDIGFPSPRGMMLAIRAGILARLHPSPCLPAQSAVACDGVVRLTAAGAAPEWLLN